MNSLNKIEIRKLLHPQVAYLIQEIDVHQSLDSTNAQLVQRADNGAVSGIVCLAEQQTAGRGRHGRNWISPPGGNIYLSLLWRYDLPSQALSGLSLACGVAVGRTLRSLGLSDVMLKWPNDILWRGRKIAGLLLDVRGSNIPGGPSRIVVGLGLNIIINQQVAAQIDQPWAALEQMPGGLPCSRNKLVAMLINELVTALEVFAKAGLHPFIADWMCYDALQGTQVWLKIGETEQEGEYMGITPDGALCLNVAGAVRTYYGGEIQHCRSKIPHKNVI